jgi:sialidase-1
MPRASESGGERRCFCRSTDDGHSWTAPQTIPMPDDVPLEVSHGLLPLSSGRLLAPAALLANPQRLGEEVFVVVSDDGGATWPARRTVFRDPAEKLGFWEQKFTEIAPRTVLAVAWTVTLGDYTDQSNSFALSHDDGWTWGPYQETGIRGQTMSVVSLGGDRLLVLYNRRYGEQGIVMALATLEKGGWRLTASSLLYNAKASRQGPQAGHTGVDELASFQFGFPTAMCGFKTVPSWSRTGVLREVCAASAGARLPSNGKFRRMNGPVFHA